MVNADQNLHFRMFDFFLLIKDQQKIVETFKKKHNLPQVQDQQQDSGTGPHATTDLVSGFALSW